MGRRKAGAKEFAVSLAAGLAAILAHGAQAQAPPAAPAPYATPGQAQTLFSASALLRPPRSFQLISLDPAFDALIAPGTELETVTLLPATILEGAMWRKGEVWVTDQKG